MRPLRFALIALAACAVAVGAVAAWKWRSLRNIAAAVSAVSEGSEWADRLTNADGVLDYLAAHRADVSLATWKVGDEDHALLLNPDQPQPLASTVKILVLAGYAARVTDRSLSADEAVPVADWDKLYLPGTDGDAHPSALQALPSRGQPVDGRVRLADLAWAMIRFSDNSATDYLLQRLGRGAVSSLPALVREPSLAPPTPLCGGLLVWRGALAEDPAARLQRWAAPDAGYPDEAWRASLGLASDDAFRAQVRQSLARDGLGLDIHGQESFSDALDNRGSARSYARIMSRVLSDELPGAVLVREQLEWPMKNAPIRAEFEHFGTKGGSLPGVLTAATFAVPKADHRPRVLALFIRRMPFGAWVALLRSFAQQDFERRLLSDDAYVETVRRRLAP